MLWVMWHDFGVAGDLGHVALSKSCVCVCVCVVVVVVVVVVVAVVGLRSFLFDIFF